MVLVGRPPLLSSASRMAENARDGVKWTAAPGSMRLRAAIAVLCVLLVAALGYWHLMQPPEAQAAQVPIAAAGGPQVAAPPPRADPPPPRPSAAAIAAKPASAGNPAAKPAAQPEDEPMPDGGEVYLEQLPRGDGGGIDAFPRPGTKPILRGIIVPDGFALPQGYVAHVQATDDGRELPPILMFHPDYHPPGVSIPENRVVPESMAPPGMPIEWLNPPPLRDPDAGP
jgi:hypothetical protein